jgi:anthranilate/para-aminobenzoate synthase component I
MGAVFLLGGRGREGLANPRFAAGDLDTRGRLGRGRHGERPAGRCSRSYAWTTDGDGSRSSAILGRSRGYFSYDIVRSFEKLPDPPLPGFDVPDALLLFSDVVLAIDKLYDRALVIATTRVIGDAPGQVYDEAVSRIESTIARLRSQPGPAPLQFDPEAPACESTSSYSKEHFERDVERIREYIRAGDAFQVVLSQRLTSELRAAPPFRPAL